MNSSVLPEPDPRCMFCGKSSTEVKRLIVSQNFMHARQPLTSAMICNECVDLCAEVLADDMARSKDAAPSKTYFFKVYRRTCPGGTTGELIEKIKIEAPGLANASYIAEREYMAGVEFESDFAILEGETGFVTCWFSVPSARE